MKGIQGNGFLPIIAQAIAEMEEQHGEFSSIDDINLAELGRRTGLSRAKLRRLKANGFCEPGHGLARTSKPSILDGYSSVLDGLLRAGVSNSVVCLKRLKARLYWQPNYCKEVYLSPQAPSPGQTAAGCAAGQPWTPLLHGSR